MHGIYLDNFRKNYLLKASLPLLAGHLTFPRGKSLTNTPYGPFFLTSNNAPFVFAFFRMADRCFYHSLNAWRLLINDLSVSSEFAQSLEVGSRVSTGDKNSKYEIEAFVSAFNSIVSAQLIGIRDVNKQNLLGSSVHGLGDKLVTELSDIVSEYGKFIYKKKWVDLRNSALHLNPSLIDKGYEAHIEKVGEALVVKLEGIYYIEEMPVDLVEVFTEASHVFIEMVTKVRDIVTRFAFELIACPDGNTYMPIQDELGNMLVGLGPNGYEERCY